MPGILMQVVSSRFLRSVSARPKTRRVFKYSHTWGKKKKPDRRITPSNMMGVNKTTQSLWWACWGESKGQAYLRAKDGLSEISAQDG